MNEIRESPPPGVSWKEYTDIRLAAQEQATRLARESMEKRLETMNEFRAQLKDQASTFFTRTEHNLFLDRVNAELTILKETNARAEGKASQTSVLFLGAVAVMGLLLSIITLLMVWKPKG